MKFSEAIMLGSTMVPKMKGTWYSLSGTGPIGACAVGAAALAIGHVPFSSPCVLDEVGKHWPWTADNKARHSCPEPDCAVRTEVVVGLVIHLNDHHEWTRERIAEWVASIEPADPEVVAAETEVMRSELCEAASSGK